MSKAWEMSACREFCKIEGVADKTLQMIRDLEYLDRSLCTYLDQKRNKFSRLYFVSNDELIELMGQLKNTEYLQTFISKLFEGVDGFTFEATTRISGFFSKTGEKLLLKNIISTDHPPEVWLRSFEFEMKRSIYEYLNRAVSDYFQKEKDNQLEWISSWPGQIIIIVMQIVHHNNMNRAFTHTEPDCTHAGLYQDILKQIEFLSTLVK